MDQEGIGREWESEFQKTTPTSSLLNQVDAPTPGPNSSIPLLTLSLILASQSLPLVTSQKLKALPLTALSQLLTSCIFETFHGGEILRENATGDSEASALRQHIASLTRLEALVLSLLLNSWPREGLACAQETTNSLLDMTSRVEGVMPALSRVDNSSGPWQTLKTLLFSIIMISDSILSACIYVPSTVYHNLSPTSSLSSPASLALTTLLTLSRLSLLISQFGGISSLSGAADDTSFKEMRKTVYLALDILASGSGGGSVTEDVKDVAQHFVDELCASLPSRSRGVGAGSNTEAHDETLDLAKISFALACIEQLVPVLGVKYLRGPVWTLIEPNLVLRPLVNSDTSESIESGSNSLLGQSHQLADQLKRDTFESAHSVVLGIFAANTATDTAPALTLSQSEFSVAEDHVNLKGKGKKEQSADMSLADFCTRLVPFYVKSLIENSAQGKLSTSQLRIAYAALVRSASTSASAPEDGPTGNPSQFTLAWYCIDALLSVIQDTVDIEQRHRLHLTLISCVSALPLSLLGRVLEEIDGVLNKMRLEDGHVHENSGDVGTVPDLEQGKHRTELVTVLYREVLEVVGDREKEYVVRWWAAFASRGNSEPTLMAKL
ncbi:hypothetical protein BDP27DRAFT_1322576 [Rhodocollybia butyracea]|uniref:Uncharacterized protein n=1 Tax=Rhodocollybia butyracea TaxID=206335 RepID=A0A9P5U9Q4_9AGAR|nr:hypothetical protein BDP27DRAFT_1322576 [Rhodocollybia butyracea]